MFGRRSNPTYSHGYAVVPRHAAPSIVPQSTEHEDAPFLEKARAVGNEIITLLRAAYSDKDDRLYAESAIAAAAGLAGEFALRATVTPLPREGSLVPGSAQDKVLFADRNKPTAWSMIVRAATVAGVEADDFPDLAEIAPRAASSIGQAGFPPLTVPLANRPREWTPNACARLRAEVTAITTRHGLTQEELAIMLGWVTGSLILMTRNSLRPATSTRLAAETMIALSRMAPLAKPIAELRS